MPVRLLAPQIWSTCLISFLLDAFQFNAGLPDACALAASCHRSALHTLSPVALCYAVSCGSPCN